MRKLIAGLAAALALAGVGLATTQSAPDAPADAGYGSGAMMCFDDGTDFSWMCTSL